MHTNTNNDPRLPIRPVLFRFCQGHAFVSQNVRIIQARTAPLNHLIDVTLVTTMRAGRAGLVRTARPVIPHKQRAFRSPSWASIGSSNMF
jgi:hypothetical protein